jgi:tungstate transport system ATP-binding protein
MRARPSELPIRFEGVTVRAGAVTILSDIGLAIEAGPPTVVIGPNGSGKTTLLRVAMGLTAPSSGRVTWDGVAGTPPLHRAIVFQRPVMLRRSVEANLHYALRTARIARSQAGGRIEELLSLVGLDGMARRPARRLSGGEQQRLALARALARDPAVLFLDEPTASLDPAATHSVEEIVRATSARGIKIVMATHDLGEARRLAGEVVFLHRGEIAERGDAASFFAAPKTAAARAFLAGDLLL